MKADITEPQNPLKLELVKYGFKGSLVFRKEGLAILEIICGP
jgi:hypothetical protein